MPVGRLFRLPSSHVSHHPLHYRPSRRVSAQNGSATYSIFIFSSTHCGRIGRTAHQFYDLARIKPSLSDNAGLIVTLARMLTCSLRRHLSNRFIAIGALFRSCVPAIKPMSICRRLACAVAAAKNISCRYKFHRFWPLLNSTTLPTWRDYNLWLRSFAASCWRTQANSPLRHHTCSWSILTGRYSCGRHTHKHNHFSGR